MPLKDDELKEVSGGNLIDAINFGTGALPEDINNMSKDGEVMLNETLTGNGSYAVDRGKDLEKHTGKLIKDSISTGKNLVNK